MLTQEALKELKATKLPIRAKDKGEYSNTAIYSMPNEIGLYRRVSRNGRTGLQTGDGRILAIIPSGNRQGEPVDGLCELMRWAAGEQLLRPLLPGVESPNPDQDDTPY